MLSNKQLFAVYNWSTAGCDGFLVLLYSAVIYIIYKGNRDQFATLVSALMVVSNFAGIFVIISNYFIFNENENHVT